MATFPDRARFDVNKRPTLTGVSNIDGESPVTLWADPTTHALVIAGGSSGGGGGIVTVPYDYISVAYPNTTTEVYSYYIGGAGGTLVATVTVVYTDATKANISTVTKT